MDDFSRLGVTEISTENSVLISSSKYLNEPRLRDALTTAMLRRNGRERRVGWDSTPIVRAYWEVRDVKAINAMIATERARNPALDAFFSARHISTFTRTDLARYAPHSLGGIFYAYLAENDLDIDLDPRLRRDPNWRPSTDLEYFELRAAQTHDFEHILGGVGFDALAEVVPFWMRIENYHAHMTPELAGELAALYVLLVLPMQTRTALHYPRAWPMVSRFIERGIQLGRVAAPLYMVRYEDLLSLSLPEARAKLSIPLIEEIDSYELSDYFSEGAQLANAKATRAVKRSRAGV